MLPPSFRRPAHRARCCLAAILLVVIAGCGTPAVPPPTLRWLVGQTEPPFDPTGPADPVRWALERLTGEGLVAEDSTGRIVQAAAQRWDVTPDGLTYTFHLRPGLRYDDGSECTSADFRRAIEAGLARVDHATYAWLLSPIVGVDQVRPGRPLPALGIATPDGRTLVLRLARADPTLLHKLALPGASMPWADGAGHGGWGGGIGRYRVVSREPGRRMVLARRAAADEADTVRVEFSISASRGGTALRQERADLLWPLPPGMLAQALPPGYRQVALPSRPARRLWLIMRHDLPPTRKIQARRALAHGLNRTGILTALGPQAAEPGTWLSGGGVLDLPPRDPAAVREWLELGGMGRSLHVVLAFAADGVGAEVARGMQTDWAGLALDVELRPLRRAAMTSAALGRGGAQLLLIEAQPPLGEPVTELATLVPPRSGPPVGTFRTGWATREFDRWIGPQPPVAPLDLELVQRRLGEELTVVPLARLPWLWVEREGGPRVGRHPHFGPVPGAGPGSGTVPPQSR